jgi:ankyrin repeat protein
MLDLPVTEATWPASGNGLPDSFGLRLRKACICLAVCLAAPTVPAGDTLGLADAAMQADAARMAALLAAGADPNVPGTFGTPALHWRVDADDLAAVRQLLAAGADANSLTERGISPLALAIANGNAAMVRVLLQAGARADQPAISGETLLMRAAEVGVPEVVELLLQQGMPVDERESQLGQTALMFAARAGHAGVVATLLAHGAEPNVATPVGRTPAFIAPNSARGFGFGEGIIRGGVPADRGRREPTPGGLTPLHFAARQNHVEVAKTAGRGRCPDQRPRSQRHHAAADGDLQQRRGHRALPAGAGRCRQCARLVWAHAAVGSGERA